MTWNPTLTKKKQRKHGDKGEESWYKKEYEKENSEKISAQRKVRRAVRSGKLIRPMHCEICGENTKAHGHHEDYNKPLEVIWMCAKCHLYHHQKYRFHAERLNEKTPKGDAKVRTTNESSGGESEAVFPPSKDGQ